MASPASREAAAYLAGAGSGHPPRIYGHRAGGRRRHDAALRGHVQAAEWPRGRAADQWAAALEGRQGGRGAGRHPRATPARPSACLRCRAATSDKESASCARALAARGRSDDDGLHEDHAARRPAGVGDVRQRGGVKKGFASLPPRELNFGAKITTKSPWWPQRDSNPCFSHDHVFAVVFLRRRILARQEYAASKTRGLHPLSFGPPHGLRPTGCRITLRARSEGPLTRPRPDAGELRR